ncbi:hypothetical protein [Staphylococcus aureus]
MGKLINPIEHHQPVEQSAHFINPDIDKQTVYNTLDYEEPAINNK